MKVRDRNSVRNQEESGNQLGFVRSDSKEAIQANSPVAA